MKMVIPGGAGFPATTDASGNPAARVVVSDQHKPDQITYQDYAFGADDTFATIVVNTDTDGTWVDISKSAPGARSLAIICENASPSYQYTVLFGRMLADTEAYVVVTKAASTEQFQFVNLPNGFDRFCLVRIHADAGQAGTQLNFKAVLSGRAV